MKRIFRVTLLGINVCFIACLFINICFSQIRGGCKREPLNIQTNQFLSALEANKPSVLTLASDVKYTENGKELLIGEGFWKTAGKILLKRSVVDREKCSTHTQAVIEEEGNPIIYGVRLKFDKENITEVESFVARKYDWAFNVEKLLSTKFQDWESIIPIEERSSRLAMIAMADDYFEMFKTQPSVHVDFADNCNRWENGTLTTKKPDDLLVSDVPGQTCSPVGLVAPNHKPRRFLVDREAGVVVAYLMFASVYPDFHMFKIRNGKVELIQAVIGSGSATIGWPDQSACE